MIPTNFRPQQELYAQLAVMGVSPGPPEQTLSGQLFVLSMHLKRPPAS